MGNARVIFLKLLGGIIMTLEGIYSFRMYYENKSIHGLAG